MTSGNISISMITNSYDQFVNGLRNPDGTYKLDEEGQAQFKGIDADIQALLKTLEEEPGNMTAMLELQGKMGELSAVTTLSSNLIKVLNDIMKELARAIS